MAKNDKLIELRSRYEDYKRGSKQCYFDVDELIALIHLYLANLNFDEVTNIVQLAIDTHPNNPRVRKLRALNDLIHGEVEQALQILDEIGDDDEDSIMMRITAWLILGNLKNARLMADKMINNQEEDIGAAYIDVARCFMMSERYRDSIKYLKLGLERFPDDVDIMFQMGICYKEAEKWRSSEKMFLKVLDYDSFDDAAWFNLAHVYFNQNKLLKALESINYVIAINPHEHVAILFKARVLSIMGRYQESNETLLEALQEGANRVDVYMGIGDNYSAQDMNEKALEWYDKASEKMPDNWEGHLNKIDAMLSLKMFEECFALLDKMKAAGLSKVRYWANMSRVYHDQGNRESALKCIERAYNLDKDDPVVSYHCALMSLEYGDYRAAKRYVLRAIKNYERYPYAYNPLLCVVLAAAHYKLGEYKKMAEIAITPEFLHCQDLFVFFDVCPELCQNFGLIIDAIRKNKDFSHLLVYPDE